MLPKVIIYIYKEYVETYYFALRLQPVYDDGLVRTFKI